MAAPAAPSVWLVGGEDVRLRLPFADELRARGFQVEIVGSESEEPFVSRGVPYHRYRLSRFLDPAGDLRTYRDLRALFTRAGPSVVHSFDTKPSILGTLAAREAAVPVRVRTVTGAGYVFSSRSPLALSLRRPYRVLQRAASRAASVTVFQNVDDRSEFVSRGMAAAERSELVPGSGIDVSLLQARPGTPETLAKLRSELGLGDGPVVTMVSRLVRHKGVREFCAAAAEVRASRPDSSFLLVGPLASEGWQSVGRREVERSRDVLWLGARDDVPALLALSTVFALPSYYREGIPRSLLEAGALGLPLVTTDMPGCRDVVRDGWNGFLVPTRDAHALAAAVERLLTSSPEERARMGERSRNHVEQGFTLDVVADAYAALYRRLLETRR